MGLIQSQKLTLDEEIGIGTALKCNNFEFVFDQTTETHSTNKPRYRHG